MAISDPIPINVKIALISGVNPKRNWFQIKIGSVGSAPVKNREMSTSSNDKVNPSKAPPMTAVLTSGKVIRLSVCTGVAPRSDDASFNEGSRLFNLLNTISMMIGITNVAWPITTLTSELYNLISSKKN